MTENQGDIADQLAGQNDQEEMLPKSYVNKIVMQEKAKAAEAALRKAEERHQQELAEMKAMQAQKQEQRNEQVPKQVDANAIYQQVQESFNQEWQRREKEHQEEQMQNEMRRIANQYQSKIDTGKTAYKDFDEVTKDFDPAAFPQLTFLIAGIDNAADVLYDLAKNPSKLATLDRLAEKNPRMAQNELLKLSASINVNKEAQANADSQKTAAPLNRLQASRVSGSNGKMGISDLRNLPWLQG